MQTPVQFTTNIDCCKKYMGSISGLPLEYINPLVGDRVLIYHDTAIEVWLQVVGRQWRMNNGNIKLLECELHLLPGWTIDRLEKFLRN